MHRPQKQIRRSFANLSTEFHTLFNVHAEVKADHNSRQSVLVRCLGEAAIQAIRTLADVPAVQEEIGRSVVSAFRKRFGTRGR